ncbi:hypothetical protein PoB_006669500 [Plakobranchus ocellatus]|uniref:Uncharacterized protein n=1 Tax=Plakobranchus ocellatus TaxID=259542 RepID=A0AAV4D7Z4_9GAST|nr:hypothetical protein PoB_006669500 [Plakobranchus ocellatus]
MGVPPPLALLWARDALEPVEDLSSIPFPESRWALPVSSFMPFTCTRKEKRALSSAAPADSALACVWISVLELSRNKVISGFQALRQARGSGNCDRSLPVDLMTCSLSTVPSMHPLPPRSLVVDWITCQSKIRGSFSKNIGELVN